MVFGLADFGEVVCFGERSVLPEQLKGTNEVLVTASPSFLRGFGIGRYRPRRLFQL